MIVGMQKDSEEDEEEADEASESEIVVCVVTHDRISLLILL